MIKKYFYRLLYRYLSIYIRPGESVVEVDPQSIPDFFFKGTVILRTKPPADPGYAGFQTINDFSDLAAVKPDYVLLNGNIHYERDIQGLFDRLYDACTGSARIVITYYSSLWKPLIGLATKMGLRKKEPEYNWLTTGDVENVLVLSNFERVLDESRILLPLNIPAVSYLVNRYLAPLPFFRTFCVVHVMIARPLKTRQEPQPSVSVVVPARNESGNIESAVRRIPKMGPSDEIIFIEGNSTDDTWEKIREVKEKYSSTHTIVIAQQDGHGKGDAVRKGFDCASRDILMILDADLTVPPECLPLFYRALVENKGEFINGSRLVYPMEEKAMRFFNILGNKFFAVGFSFVLGQRFKDTLCGTKALRREQYKKLASHRSYFGDFDPFGDFDLILGSMRLGLKIREIPVNYKERAYGETNIQRWRHGVILLSMLIYAARKIKFV